MENELIDMIETASCDKIPRRVLPIFFMIDSSGGMKGSICGAVNSVMERIFSELESVDNPDFEIKVSVLKISDGCEWLFSKPLSLPFEWTGIVGDGLCDFCAACKELNEKLSKKSGYFADFNIGAVAPIIVLMLLQPPTDDTDEGKNGISLLKDNKYFMSSNRFAISLNCDCIERLCNDFADEADNVFSIDSHVGDFASDLYKTIHEIIYSTIYKDLNHNYNCYTD